MLIDEAIRQAERLKAQKMIAPNDIIETLLNAAKQQQWISCHTKYPSEEGETLVFAEFADGSKGKYSDRYQQLDNGKWAWLTEVAHVAVKCKVTHWMPLPDDPVELAIVRRNLKVVN